MSLRYLLDTNVVSEPVRSRPSPSLMARLEREAAVCAISSVVLHELRYGCVRMPPSDRRRAFEEYVVGVASRLPVLDYDASAAAWHAEERARLEGKGKTPTFVDGMIAAVAAVRGLTLVTRDRRGFTGFRGVEIESWD
ncbi:MAG TPA: type II toxin-antitoxin system VapC family toxin [Candidatus Polarisedimenticolaceae bacterium]